MAGADGADARRAVAADYGGHLAPDGSRIVFTSLKDASGKPGEYVWIYDIAAQKAEPLRIAGERHLAPTWSPDGSKLLFGTISNGWRPAVLDLDAGKLTVFSASAAKGLMYPFWSANGDVLFTAHRAAAKSDGVENVYRVTPGCKPELLVKDAGGISSSR